MSVTGLASAAATKSASSSFSSGFMNMPPTLMQGSGEKYYVRLANVPREVFGKRGRYRPIMTFGNPADFVSGPTNAGDSTTTAEAQGGGSFATSTRYNS